MSPATLDNIIEGPEVIYFRNFYSIDNWIKK